MNLKNKNIGGGGGEELNSSMVIDISFWWRFLIINFCLPGKEFFEIIKSH